MNHKTVRTIVLSVGFIVGGMVLFSIFKSFRKPPRKVDASRSLITVRVQSVVRDTFPERLSGYGMARAHRDAILSAEISGVVSNVRVSAGSTVNEGDILVLLDDRDVSQALTRAKAAFEKGRLEQASLKQQVVVARGELGASRRELARLQHLRKENQASASELDRQRLQTSQLEKSFLSLDSRSKGMAHEVKALNATVLEAEHNLARASVRAPFKGRIEGRPIDVGVRVGIGTRLLRLVDPTSVEVSVALGGSHFGEVKEGAVASIRLHEEGANIWKGTVSRISATIDENSRTFQAYLDVGVPGGASPIPPGAFVITKINGLVHKNIIAVPRISFVKDHVFVINREGGSEATVVQRKPVVRRFLTDVALIEAGLEPGDEIIITNLEEISDGSRVRIHTSEDQGAPPADTVRVKEG